MYSDAIAYWAKQRPNAMAIAGIRGVVSYQAFDQAINNIAAGLSALDLPEAGLVALQMDNLYALYLLERALGRLGVTVVVLPPTPPSQGQLDLLKADALLTFLEASLPTHPKATLISTDWMDQVLNGPLAAPPTYRPRPDDVVRLMVSSGTTGLPKKIPITRDSLERRCRISTMTEGIGQSSRLFLATGPQTIAGFVYPLVFWSQGATVTIHDARDTLQEIARLKPTFINLSTGVLESILNLIPQDAAPLSGVRLTAGGSQVTRSLASRTVSRLSQDFWILYGSTELSTVTSGHASMLNRHERAVGYVAPGMDVQVVDAEDGPLATGETGILRMRGEGLFSGYLDDDETTASAWRDGWFYPGDIGSLTDDGLLIIEGRTAELMNLGGMKIDPGAVDELAKTCAGVADAASFALPDQVGLERPWIAVVPKEGFEPPVLIAELQARWPVLRDLRVAVIDAIPRNGMLKVERQKLKQLVVDAHRRDPAAPAG